MSVEQALKRPLDYNKLSARQQWAIDKHLGILDWDPIPEEIRQYLERRAEQLKRDGQCRFRDLQRKWGQIGQ